MWWHCFCKFLIGAGQLCLWRILYILNIIDSCHVMLVLSRSSGSWYTGRLIVVYIWRTAHLPRKGIQLLSLGRQNHPFHGVFCELVCHKSDSVLRLYDHLSFEFPRGGYEADRSCGLKTGGSYWACCKQFLFFFVLEKTMFLATATTFNRTCCF